MARRALKAGNRSKFNAWWGAGAMLGILFLFGQALAWQQLKDLGIYVAANPSSARGRLWTAGLAAFAVYGVCRVILPAI